MLNKTRLVLLVAILSAAAGAVVFKTPSVLFLLGTLIAAPVLAGAIGKWMSRGLRVSRQMPLVGTVGDELRARLTVRNSGLVPALLVHARGRGPAEKPRRARWRRGKSERNVVSPSESEHYFEAIGEAELIVPILMPGASFSGEVAWKLRRRGLIEWPGARAGTVDPIALHDVLTARDAPAQLLILPRPLKLRRLSLSDEASSEQPLRRMAAAADAAEVHGVRPYQPGEGGRRIHWRATARTGQLHVIEWEEETAADLTILLDVQASLIAGRAGDDTLEHAITAAASVAAFLLERGQRARIFWWQDDVAADSSPQLMRVESRHQSGLTQILTALAKIVPSQNALANLAALSQRVARETGDESVLLIASDKADWNAAKAVWTGHSRVGMRGLAFESASFEATERDGFSMRAGVAVTATLQRAEASKVRPRPPLPAGVRRIARGASLVDALEKEF